MNDSAEPAPVTPSNDIPRRVAMVMLKLLVGIEHDIDAGTLPSPHLAAYEAMLRAEQMRGMY